MLSTFYPLFESEFEGDQTICIKRDGIYSILGRKRKVRNVTFPKSSVALRSYS